MSTRANKEKTKTTPPSVLGLEDHNVNVLPTLDCVDRCILLTLVLHSAPFSNIFAL